MFQEFLFAYVIFCRKLTFATGSQSQIVEAITRFEELSKIWIIYQKNSKYKMFRFNYRDVTTGSAISNNNPI